jgi:hypothetical protein
MVAFFCFVRCVGVLSSGINQKLRHKNGQTAKISSNPIRCFVRTEMIGAPSCSGLHFPMRDEKEQAPIDVNSTVVSPDGSARLAYDPPLKEWPIECTTCATIPGHLSGGQRDPDARLDETVT